MYRTLRELELLLHLSTACPRHETSSVGWSSDSLPGWTAWRDGENLKHWRPSRATNQQGHAHRPTRFGFRHQAHQLFGPSACMMALAGRKACDATRARFPLVRTKKFPLSAAFSPFWDVPFFSMTAICRCVLRTYRVHLAGSSCVLTAGAGPVRRLSARGCQDASFGDSEWSALDAQAQTR
jgi:hypothetical protein